MTAATRVCCSMISDTQIWYGDVVLRHGRGRWWQSYHASKCVLNRGALSVGSDITHNLSREILPIRKRLGVSAKKKRSTAPCGAVLPGLYPPPGTSPNLQSYDYSGVLVEVAVPAELARITPD